MQPSNEELWDQLVQHDVLCSRPKYEMTAETAREYLSRSELYGEQLQGKKVLCLASGGGQQSIAFSLLGATVTVVDFSAEQLQKDQEIAKKFEVPLRLIKSDMRDLAMFEEAEFDLVYQPYSLNYVPSVQEVFSEVARILKPGGIYDLMFHNPYVHGTWKDGCWGNEWAETELWEGKGYPLWQPYYDGYPIQTHDPNWNFVNQADQTVRLPSPQEYRHTLSTVLTELLQRKLELIRFQEEKRIAKEAQPGTWEHYQSVAPPWFYVVCRKKEA